MSKRHYVLQNRPVYLWVDLWYQESNRRRLTPVHYYPTFDFTTSLKTHYWTFPFLRKKGRSPSTLDCHPRRRRYKMVFYLHSTIPTFSLYYPSQILRLWYFHSIIGTWYLLIWEKFTVDWTIGLIILLYATKRESENYELLYRPLRKV